MRWGITSLVVLLVVGLGDCEAWAEWQKAFRTVVDTKIHALQQDAVRPERFLLGIEGGILESKDTGSTWRRALTVPANQAVQILYQETEYRRWWAVTSRTLYRSLDEGRKWEPAAQFLSAEGRVQSFLADGSTLYLGWSDGLSMSLDEGASWSNVPEFSGRMISQISRSQSGDIWVASDRGVYRGRSGSSWESVYRCVSLGSSTEIEESDETASVPVEEEAAETVSPLYFWFTPGGGLTVVDGQKRIHMDPSTGRQQTAGRLPATILLAPSMAGDSGGRMFLATDRGVYLWTESTQILQELSSGWSGSDARFLAYDAAGDQLMAVTSHGVFRYEHPDLNGYLETRLHSNSHKSEALLNQFAHEPQILELQEAAMQYAEVDPDKIIAWRRAAAKRALLPSLSVGRDLGSDQTVDIDRGGTADVDRFIQGPDEKDQQWTVDVSWNLADLIWSDDQTSIDNRSKLMVQLRDDLLTQLNSLYYARRRLQVARLIESGNSLQKEVERNLQIDEYTAGIDALTGGYFSKKLNQSVRLEQRAELA